MIALDVGGLISGMAKTIAAFVLAVLVCAVMVFLVRGPPSSSSTHSLFCHAAGGWWVAATLDKHGEPKMWACVDDAGRLVRLSEEK